MIRLQVFVVFLEVVSLKRTQHNVCKMLWTGDWPFLMLQFSLRLSCIPCIHGTGVQTLDCLVSLVTQTRRTQIAKCISEIAKCICFKLCNFFVSNWNLYLSSLNNNIVFV